MKNQILLVEDDAFLHKLYLDLLTGDGYNAVGTTDGMEAYKKIVEEPWLLVLLDVMLPSLSGFEIMKKLVQSKKRPTCPIIFMSNLEEGQISSEQEQLVQGVWVKSSMSPPEFLTRVKSLIK